MDLTYSGIDGLRAEFQAMESIYGQSGTYTVYTDVEYALYQELGTIHHAPQPHVRPGIQHGRARMNNIAQQSASLDELLHKTAEEILNEIRRRAPVKTGRLRDSYDIEVND